jgi:hypothetical protein
MSPECVALTYLKFWLHDFVCSQGLNNIAC